jgi:hypothetical protein
MNSSSTNQQDRTPSSASYLDRKHGFSLIDDIQKPAPKVNEVTRATRMESSSPSGSKGSFDSLIEYYTQTARLHQDKDRSSSLKNSQQPSSTTHVHRQPKLWNMEETKDCMLYENDDNMDERERYLSRGFSEISASSVLLSLSSADLQQFSSDLKLNEGFKIALDVSNTRTAQDVPEFHRSVSFKDNISSTIPSMPRHYSQSDNAEETKDDAMDEDSANIGDRVFGRASSEISMEACSVVLFICSSI